MQVFQDHSEANKSCSVSGENFIPNMPFGTGEGGHWKELGNFGQAF